MVAATNVARWDTFSGNCPRRKTRPVVVLCFEVGSTLLTTLRTWGSQADVRPPEQENPGLHRAHASCPEPEFLLAACVLVEFVQSPQTPAPKVWPRPACATHRCRTDHRDLKSMTEELRGVPSSFPASTVGCGCGEEGYDTLGCFVFDEKNLGGVVASRFVEKKWTKCHQCMADDKLLLHSTTTKTDSHKKNTRG